MQARSSRHVPRTRELPEDRLAQHRHATSLATPGVSPAWPPGPWFPKRQTVGRVLSLGTAMGWSEHERHLGRELEEARLPGTAPGAREEAGLAVRKAPRGSASPPRPLTRAFCPPSLAACLGRSGDQGTTNASPGTPGKEEGQRLVSSDTREQGQPGRALSQPGNQGRPPPRMLFPGQEG